MKTFLEHVAQDIIRKYGHDLSHMAVVFPNKRASLFFNEHLVRASGRPLWTPSYTTISELFRSHSPLTVGSPIKLVCDLHHSFVQCTGIDETLDHFYGWGQLLLSDFDDIDKNMADADKVFANLRDIHELDDISYLTAEQREMIRKFFSNFTDDHNTELKRRFLSLWSHFGDIYHDYNERLARQSLAYEGALYRQVATDEQVTFDHERYLFVGFNLLQKVEQKLFKTLSQQGKGAFYWDYDQYYMPRPSSMHHEAGHFIAQYLKEFPNELDGSDNSLYSQFSQPKDITYIAAPTENIQAKYISTWLREQQRYQDGKRTAIVLCDESLLQTVIHCIPAEVKKVNITTGYPLSQSPVSSLLNMLISLQTTGYVAHADKYRLNYVNKLLKHPYMPYISQQHGELYQQLNIDSKVYYPDRRQLSVDEGTTLLFSSLDADDRERSFQERLVRWLLRVLRLVAANARTASDPLFQESLFRLYTIVNQLSALIASNDLVVDTITLQRLMFQLIQTTTIPFHGEPAEGIQIMGVLETRNLDFDHVLLLSCNEGNMPKGVNDASFIPHSIRKAYELTTVDNKVAIYAYYFHRLLQRASDVTLAYNNSTEDGKTGEMSRFMLQLMVESSHPVRQYTLRAGQAPTLLHPKPISKSAEVMEAMLRLFDKQRQADASADKPLLTPTAINKYMRCPLQFFYNYVDGLREPDDDDDETIDNRIFGNIFHEAADGIYQRLLQKSPTIRRSDLQELLKTKVDIERAVDEAFKKELFKVRHDAAFHPEYNGLQLINREVIIHYLRQLLEIDMNLAPFTIVGLEETVCADYTVSNEHLHFTTTMGGRIDRLDCVSSADGEERIRVIDYKTGSRRLKSLPDVAAIFDATVSHSDYYLQTFLYSMIVRHSTKYNADGFSVSPALLFIQHTADDYDPTLRLGREPVTDIADTLEPFDSLLQEKVNEIFNPAVPFTPTDNRELCARCPYAHLCG